MDVVRDPLDAHDIMAGLRGHYLYECQVNDCDCAEELQRTREDVINELDRGLGHVGSHGGDV